MGLKRTVIQAFLWFAAKSMALDECHFNGASPDQACPLSQLDDGTLIYPGGNTSCYHSTSNNPNPYFFQVQPGSDGKENNLFIYFQGGGFCTKPENCIPGWAHRTPFVEQLGVFNTRDSRNPFRGWTFVMVLYCSADGHVGNAVSADGSVRWNGRNNAKTVLSWMYANVPNPDRIFMLGSSAGSFGLQYWSHSIIQHFQDLDVPPIISVIYEAWVGLEPWNGAGVDTWDVCSAADDLSWPPELKAYCYQQGNQSLSKQVQLFTQAAHRDIPFGFLACKDDATQRRYICLSGPLRCSQAQFYAQMKGFLDNYAQAAISRESGNFLNYWINDRCHITMGHNYFLWGRIGGPNSTTNLLDWVTDLGTRSNNTLLHSVCTPSTSRMFDYGCDATLSNTSFGFDG